MTRCSAQLCVGPQAFALPQLGPSPTRKHGHSKKPFSYHPQLQLPASYRTTVAWFWTTVSTTVSVTLGTRMIFSSTDIFGTSWEVFLDTIFSTLLCSRVCLNDLLDKLWLRHFHHNLAHARNISRQVTSNRFGSHAICQVPSSTGFCTILCSSWTTCLTQGEKMSKWSGN